jgi:hypothetical protein
MAGDNDGQKPIAAAVEADRARDSRVSIVQPAGSDEIGDNGRGDTGVSPRLLSEERPDAPPVTPWGTVRKALSGSWGVVLAVLAVVPGIVAFLGLVFALFPSLKPPPPTEVRSIAVTRLALGERNRDLSDVPGDDRVANVVFFEVESTGYVADDLAVYWLVLDAQSRERVDEKPLSARWARTIDFNTQSDRVVGTINVPPPSDHPGCVFVRVLVQANALSGGDEPTEDLPLLDAADSPPFDPNDIENPSCPDAPARLPPLMRSTS